MYWHFIRYDNKKFTERNKMKLTEKNLNNVFNYIITQISDEDFGEFDEETPIITAVQRTIEMLEEVK